MYRLPTALVSAELNCFYLSETDNESHGLVVTGPTSIHYLTTVAQVEKYQPLDATSPSF